MRGYKEILVGSVLAVLLVAAGEARAQDPSGKGKDPKPKNAQGAPDEEREILKEIKEAYKAPFEVHEDVLKELRRSYQQPTPDRERKIFSELRRLYQLVPEQENAILAEIRRAYQQPTPEQEERLFAVIQRSERLPPNTVPPSIQAEQTRKIFQKLDMDGNGALRIEEMPEALRNERGRWDMNRDGFVDLNEYWTYYQGRLQHLSEQVATGQIDLKLGKASPVVILTPPPMNAEEQRPTVFRAGKLPRGLPDWFAKLDTDGDGQIGLYEWRKSGQSLEEFVSMDRNNDGFITAEEMLHFLALQPRSR